MGFLDSWQSLPDTQTLQPGQQARIHLIVGCTGLSSALYSPVGTQDVLNALNGITDFNVSDVSYDNSVNSSNLLSFNWGQAAFIVSVNVPNALQVGQLRNEVYALMSAWNSNSQNGCSQLTVGAIELDVPFSLNPLSPGPGNPIAQSFGGIVLILALVVAALFFFGRDTA